MKQGSIDVWADSRLLRQAILNLIRNGAEAIPDDATARRVTIKLDVVEQESRRWASISIHDTGPGIPVADLSKIFIPFFTTKSQGHGVGLALAHRVITEHGGSLTVENSSEGGAAFTALLPA
jgi:signal transduction histidine kinase